MIDKYSKLVNALGKNRVVFNEPLNKYSSFHVGGPADLFFRAKTTDDLVTAVVCARNLHIPYFVLGGGTNLLIADKGFRGVVIKNETSSIKTVGIRGGKTTPWLVYLEADSGVGVNRLVRFTLDQELHGLEAFLGQPGSVGGAVWINAHNMKMRKFIADTIVGAKILNSENKIVKIDRNYFKFSYDQSVIQRTNDLVISVTFRLERSDKEKVWQIAQSALDYRRKTQPQGIFSSGCTFRNIKKSDAMKIPTPNWTISAGYLIESLNLKGKRIGGAWFSKEHANFIIHQGQATAQDILRLINLAKKKAKEKYNIDLKEEIRLLGDF